MPLTSTADISGKDYNSWYFELYVWNTFQLFDLYDYISEMKCSIAEIVYEMKWMISLVYFDT